MITSNRNNLVKEGYLDIKVPPGNRERKLWKAWQRRRLVAKTVEEPCGLELQIHGGCQKTSNIQPLWTVFISTESGKLYRSRSRTHAWAFSIANAEIVILHLAGESEQVSQSWMAAIRDALWPPSPLVQVEAAFQDVHRVSLIDDENTCHSDLFAAYGHLYMAGDVILLMSTHSGRLIKQWYLSEILKVELERLDEGKTSGVFSLTLQKGPLQYGEKLNFYSQTAHSIVQNISAALKLRQEGKMSGTSTLKYDSGIEELSDLSLEREECDRLSPLDPKDWSSQERSGGLGKLATMSGDFLNCSVNSVFLQQDFSSGSRTSSEASSDYSPPLSPMDPTSPNPDGMENPEGRRRASEDFLDHYYYYDTDTNVRRNSLEDNDLDYALIVQHRSSNSSGIYADIASLPPSKRPSLAETLYEDIEEDEEDFIKLMDQIIEDEYLPPLPPPRNTNVQDGSVGRFTKAAKRPSTLGLENLSSSISETLCQMQGQSETNSKMTKKNFPVGLFRPIKGVKRILSTKRNAKSPLPSPTKENSKNTVFSKQNTPPEAKEAATNPSESLLIMHEVYSPEADRNGNSGESLTPESICPTKNSPDHISDEHFVPFPELLPTPTKCKNELQVDQDSVKQEKNIFSDETSSVVLREGQKGKQTRSHDSLIVESLKSRYSCHRQFLKFLQVDENNVNHDTVCQLKGFLRSISLDQLPCKSSHCHQHSISTNDTLSYSAIENFRNEHLSATGLKAMNLQTPLLDHILPRRRSSDYCDMNSLISLNSEQKPETYVATMPVTDKVQRARKESVSHEWSHSLHMQLTEHQSLYMDMTRTTK